jgi:hypothetical protein
MSSAINFKKATKHESKLRLALVGPSGSGKTFSSLSIASHLGKSIAVIDTERGSASKYADLFSFDVLELSSFHPQTYIDAIRAAEGAGFDVLIIDSLSHAWMGKDGALELVDKASKRPQNGGNNFSAWRDVTPLHTALIDAILGSRMHIIATMRSKTEYVMEANKQGKRVPRKVGMAAVQRDGMEYEFDVVGDLNQEHELVITKTRCPQLTESVFTKPGKDVAAILNEWLKGEKLEVQIQPSAKPIPFPGPQPIISNQEAEELRKLGFRKGYDLDAIAQRKSKPKMAELTPDAAAEIRDWLEPQTDLDPGDIESPDSEQTIVERDWHTEIDVIWRSLWNAKVRGFDSKTACLNHLITTALSYKWITTASEIEALTDLKQIEAEAYYKILCDLYAAQQEKKNDPVY